MRNVKITSTEGVEGGRGGGKHRNTVSENGKYHDIVCENRQYCNTEKSNLQIYIVRSQNNLNRECQKIIEISNLHTFCVNIRTTRGTSTQYYYM